MTKILSECLCLLFFVVVNSGHSVSNWSIRFYAMPVCLVVVTFSLFSDRVFGGI